MRISKKQFIEWLNKQEPDAVVGYSCRTGRCPIATYLQNECNLAEAEVEKYFFYPTGIRFETKEQDRRILPKWAVEFVSLVDALNPAAASVEVPVTARKALQIIEGEQ